MKHIAAIAIACMIVPLSFSQAQFIEEIKQSSPDQIIIPYKKYKLPNGLIVILHEDHSDPVVHVDVTYHVGSAREVVGRSGFAHFFEHMMFQGSDNVADEEHFKVVTESGGTLNGTTNSDRTNYFETVPSNQLETMLWLESDRMGFFLDAVTQQKFEIQRATVKNERGQSYDNRPYGLVQERIGEALFPFGHPYSWSTIGYIEDLNAATVDDLKRFFLRWYGPNNATLTIGGDIDPAKTLAMVEKYFGSIPVGPAVENMKPQPATLEKNRYISFEDNVRFPMIRVNWPTVEGNHPDEAPLDILANILGGGNNSILYQKFMKTQKAVNAFCSHPCQELAGNMTIGIFSLPKTSLADVEKEIMAALAEFESRGVSDEDLERFKAEHESGEIISLQAVSGKVSKLAYYQTFRGNPNYITADLDRYHKVTKEDVMRVYNKYIKGKPAVILSVVPKGDAALIAALDNYKRPVAPAGFKNDLSEYENLVYNKGKDNFDRSKRPVTNPAPLGTIPTFWTQDHENGLRLIGTEYTELPLVSVRITLKAGQIREPLEKAGISNILAHLLDESTQNYSSEKIALELELLGSSISIYSSREDIFIDVVCLKKNLDKTMALLKEKMFAPAFTQEDFDLVKKQMLEAIANQKNSASTIATNVQRKLLYGSSDILSYSELGTLATVEPLTVEDVKEYYNKYWSPSIANVVVVGNLKKAEAMSALDFLKKWEKKTVAALPQHKTNTPTSTTIYLVDKPGAAQSEIRMFGPGPNFDAYGDYYKANLMNYALGGAFNSRLNLNLREDKGYTYGVRSGFAGSSYTGYFSVNGAFLKDASDSTVIEIIKELKNMRDNGVKDSELLFIQNSIGQRDALKYETPLQKAGFLQTLLEYKLDKTYVAKQQDVLKTITRFELNQLAKALLPVENSWILVVGDKKEIGENLSKLGFKVVELDADGKPVQEVKSNN